MHQRNHWQFAHRRFIWVVEQPGPILVLFIALSMMFSLHYFVRQPDTSNHAQVQHQALHTEPQP